MLCGGVPNVGETRHVCYERNACKADAEVITCHDQSEERNRRAREREGLIRGNRSSLQNAPDDERAHVAKLQRAESAGCNPYKRRNESDLAAPPSDRCLPQTD